MKTKMIMLALSGPLLLATPATRAQDNPTTNPTSQAVTGRNIVSTNIASGTNNIGAGTNIVDRTSTNAQTGKFPKALAREQLVLPATLKSRLRLTDEQQTELKQIEADFAITSQEYITANQPRIDAAMEANRQARASKDPAQVRAARAQLQQVWAGLLAYRMSDVNRIKPLLTPEQLKILEATQNQWQDHPAAEANDPAAK